MEPARLPQIAATFNEDSQQPILRTDKRTGTRGRISERAPLTLHTLLHGSANSQGPNDAAPNVGLNLSFWISPQGASFILSAPQSPK